MSNHRIRYMSLQSTIDGYKASAYVHREEYGPKNELKYVRVYNGITPSSCIRVFLAIMKMMETNEYED